MDSPDDIHEFDKQYTRALSSLKLNDISEKNKELLNSYRSFCKSKGNRISTITADLMVAIRLARSFDKDLDEITGTDFERQMEHLEMGHKDTFGYRKFIKKFFKWTTSGNLPTWVRDMKVPHKDTPVQPSDLLTKEEVDKLLNACTHSRDKALIATLLDSGMRIGALGTLRIKNVQLNNAGAVLYMSTTGRNQKTTAPKPFPITWSTGYLTAWLDVHPNKGEPDAPLWVSVYSTFVGKPMSYNALVQQLRTIVKRSKIKKRIHFHLFKHQKVTDMILKRFSDQQIKFQAGWTQDSNRMMKVYGNFRDEDMLTSIYSHYGLTPGNEKQVTLEKCPRCRTVLMPEARVCHQCALVLDAALNKEIETVKDKTQEMLLKAMDNPEFMKMLKTLMEQPVTQTNNR